KSDAATTSSHTLLPAAGQPVNAFSVDSDMFTRTGSAPSSAPTIPSASAAPVKSYRGLTFTSPAGWTSGMQQGRFIVTPPTMTAEFAVIVVLYGTERLSGSFDDWLRAKM